MTHDAKLKALKKVLTGNVFKKIRPAVKRGASFILAIWDGENTAWYCFSKSSELSAFVAGATPGLFHPEIAHAWEKEALNHWDEAEGDIVLAMLEPTGTRFSRLAV